MESVQVGNNRESKELQALRQVNNLLKEDLLIYLLPPVIGFLLGTVAVIYYGGWIKGIALFVVASIPFKLAANRFNRKYDEILDKYVPNAFTKEVEE